MMGSVVGTKLLEIREEELGESVPGKVYHLTLETKGVANEEVVAETLVRELYDRFGAKVVWIQVIDNTIEMQLVGSPFSWIGLIAAIPSILVIVGLALILWAVYVVMTEVPGWTWAILTIGIGLIILSPTIDESLKKSKREYERYRS